VLAEILANPDSFAQTLGGKRCQVVILFADIRDFTTLATAMAPEELVNLLNRYFELMVGAILKEQGTIDKFIGDAVMAEFGTPIFRGDKVETCAAVRAALGMRQALQELRQTLAQEGKPLIFNGIGINIGEVVAGNLGSSQKLEYTVIGDPVNVASRIEGLTKTLGHDILISEAVQQLVQDDFETIALGTFQLKGRSEPVGIYGVLAEK